MAHSITASNGVVLISAGAPLEEDQIGYLIRHGVEAVTIEETDARDGDTIAREIQEAGDRVENIFQTALQAPALITLKERVLSYRRETLA